jgi:hypothetical protein
MKIVALFLFLLQASLQVHSDLNPIGLVSERNYYHSIAARVGRFQAHGALL